jgi:hypothetical protein
MKIVEALKKLRVIEKRMASNSEQISEYCSKVTTEMPRFPSVDEQKKEVKALIQSNQDLMTMYLQLKRAVEHTNLTIKVEIGGKKYSLADLLVIKRKMARSMINTFSSLNDHKAQQRMRFAPQFDDKKPQVELLYSEREKLDGLRKWQDLYDNIDSRLEVLNATLDLAEEE